MTPLARLTLALLLLAVWTLVGTLTYARLGDWTFHEARYLSVIAMSTVGFGEVRQLSPEGQLFTIGYLAVRSAPISQVAAVSPAIRPLLSLAQRADFGLHLGRPASHRFDDAPLAIYDK